MQHPRKCPPTWKKAGLPTRLIAGGTRAIFFFNCHESRLNLAACRRLETPTMFTPSPGLSRIVTEMCRVNQNFFL